MRVFFFSFLFVGVFAAPSLKPKFRRGLNFIVGGDEARQGEFPYQLSLQDVSYGYPWHFCGASIHSENWAITAAHCVDGESYDNPFYLMVVAGEHSLNKDEGNEQEITLMKIIVHEEYNPNTIENDIALLMLSDFLEFDEFVQPIALPEAGHVAAEECTVSGWGTTTEGGSSASKLRKVSVPIVSDEECRKRYGENQIADTMLCAGHKLGGKDACQGDSGGPLACYDTGSTYLAGVVSWGYGCARPHYPGIYTEVAQFIDWINSNIE